MRNQNIYNQSIVILITYYLQLKNHINNNILNIILLVVCIIGAVILLGKNKHEGKTINIWYMIGEGPKLGVDLL